MPRNPEPSMARRPNTSYKLAMSPTAPGERWCLQEWLPFHHQGSTTWHWANVMGYITLEQAYAALAEVGAIVRSEKQ